MRTIDDIQADLRALAQELEQLKKGDTPAAGLDLEKISSIAARYPVKRRPLVAVSDPYAKKNYLISLLAVSRYAEDKLEESLLYAHRIAYGMHYLSEGQTLRNEYLASMTLSSEQLDECSHLFQDTPARLMLVLEMLVTAGNITAGRRNALAYIANMCTLLKLSKEDITFLGNMAAVILTGDLDQYKCKIQNTYNIFDGYLEDINFQRKLVFPKIDSKTHVRESDSKFMYYFSRTDIKFSQDRTMLIFPCLYARLGLSLYNRSSGVKTHQKNITQDISPCTYIFKQNIINAFDTKKAAKSSALLNDARQYDQFAAEASEALSRPIGVQTHPLDSKTLARKWFNEEEKKFY